MASLKIQGINCICPFVMAMACLLPCLSEARPPTPAPARWSAFSQSFDALATADGIVGAGIVLVKEGQMIAHHEFGYADREHRVPASLESIYHYGSITKTLTAIAIMQLRDRKKLALDDRITEYVPELRQVHDPLGSMDAIKLRMLHTTILASVTTTATR